MTVKKRLWSAVIGLWLLAALTAGGLLVAARLQGQRLVSVQTASMVPTFHPDDALLLRPLRPDELRPGQIIGYRSPADARVTITHRLVKIDRRAGSLTTAGDALGVTDPPFPVGSVVGQAYAVLPHLGRVLTLLRLPAALAIWLYLPAGAVIGREAIRAVNHSRTYRLPGYSH